MPKFFAAIAALLITAAGHAASTAAGRSVVYASVGPELTQYDVNTENATLAKRSNVELPDNVQYAWLHPSGHFLYVAWSNGAGKDHHGVSAFRIDPSGALQPLGSPVPLRARPVHITVDIRGKHLLIAYNDPSCLSVHTLGGNGTIGPQVKQPAGLDFGIYAHQVRADPSGKTVVLVTRGNGPTKGKPEDPGALKIFDYQDGALANRQSVAPNRGYGFQPRHLDFHPTGPWIIVSLERQNQLQVYKKLPDGSLSDQPLFTTDSAIKSGARSGQAAGTVHVHPNGRIVYQANRGGENSIAVYAIDSKTGEPTRIQNADTHGPEPRTFALDPSAKILVAGNQNAPASLAVFRVRDDGKLDFVRKYDVETHGDKNLFWMGVVPLH
jgi:6-phosphogluconolactonase (cycloisomerase 2 family)